MSRWRGIGLAGCLAAVIVAALLVLSGRDSSHAVPDGRSASRVAPAPPRSGAVAAPPARALRTSPARAAARVFLVGFGGHDPGRAVLARLRLHEWGGVVLEPGNGVSPQQVASLVGHLRRTARDAGHLAPLIVASQLGGDRLDAVPVGAPLPSQVRDAAGARRAALATANVLRPLGIGMVLAPEADTGSAGGPWAGVAYSDDPAAVGAMAAAAVAGFTQGHVAAAPGHFPGEGAASGDPALGQATVGLSLQELRRRDLTPFATLVRTAPAIQLSAASYVAFDGVTPATLLPEVIALLRHDLGFERVVVSGDLQAASLATGRPVAELAVEALQAGCDLLWIPGAATDQDAAWRAVVRALRTGAIPAARIAEALQRVSVLRAGYGLG